MKIITSYIKYLGLLLVGICLLVMSFRGDNNGDTFASSRKSLHDHSSKMKGLCWVAGDSIGDHNITQVVDVGADWISQTPFGWMHGISSPVVVLANDRVWWGETDRGLGETAIMAKEKGIKTMLKPHIWVNNANGKWRSDIEMNSDEDWAKWFKSYGDWIVHYAKVAEKYNIESLCIGTELYMTTKTHPDEWRSIIADIRSIYNGKLVYAANWYKEYEEVAFWDDLDYIGIQGYFPLAGKSNPNKKELLQSWDKHKKSLQKVSSKYGKKIIFTEIGYKNTADAAVEPWTWPQHMDEKVILSDETQRICYEALFESLWDEPWMEGFFIWKWFHTGHEFKDYETYFAARWDRRKKWMEKKGRAVGPQVYFSPQRTEALDVLRQWYQNSDK